MWHMHDVGWGWWFVGSIGMVAFWALVIYGVLSLARGTQREGPAREEDASPEELLKRRLAAGDISVEEYERVRDAMREGGTGRPRAPAMS